MRTHHRERVLRKYLKASTERNSKSPKDDIENVKYADRKTITRTIDAITAINRILISFGKY